MHHSIIKNADKIDVYPDNKCPSGNYTNNALQNNNLDEIIRLADADVSLVVSSIGMPLAKYLYEEYKVPYVIGTPYGKTFSEKLENSLRNAASSGQNINAAREHRSPNSNIAAKELSPLDSKIAVIGESITATSLAASISSEYSIPVRVLESVGDGELSVLETAGDLSCSEEDELEMELSKSEIIIADPLFEPICKGKKFIRLPHTAFSGRCFAKEEELLFDKPLNETKLGQTLKSLQSSPVKYTEEL